MSRNLVSGNAFAQRMFLSARFLRPDLVPRSKMAAEGDFLLRYRAVSNKLKRRFLRKPNVAEASEQFGLLAKELKQEECLQYAGFCNLAVARCEQTLFNAAGEALALTDAARLFLQAEKETQRLQCPGFEEHLQAATNCYSFAIKVSFWTAPTL
ncbi:40-kDa huntingtin-associated protein [Stegostoma tigrinum]|uniref:40-kDa huntingtin-associated protein n=1 Tax=Stegostoma tigrinum TaxID=3053191 RepID=UPI0028703C15|nr:40-kDa huntingtin-associated protein [Stegostoma tigrinum]